MEGRKKRAAWRAAGISLNLLHVRGQPRALLDSAACSLLARLAQL
jgi:hypothetical protein